MPGLGDDVNLVQPPAANIGTTTAMLPAPKLDHIERARLMAAALRARRVFPGPVGELVAEHMTVWAEFGWRLGGESRVSKLVDAVMALPEPT